MPTYADTSSNNFLFYKTDLLSDAMEHVKLKQFGSSVVIPHIYGIGKDKKYIFNPKIIQTFPIVEANITITNPLTPEKTRCQFISVYENSQHKHEIIIANMFLIQPYNTRTKRAINYSNLVKNLYELNSFIHNKQIATNNTYQIFTNKISNYVNGANWNVVSALFEDICDKHTIRVYTK
jgi:hypothetical protein